MNWSIVWAWDPIWTGMVWVIMGWWGYPQNTGVLVVLDMLYFHHIVTKVLANNGSENGLWPDSTMPLPEPLLTEDCWHPSQRNFTENIWGILAKIMIWIYGVFCSIFCTSSRVQWVRHIIFLYTSFLARGDSLLAPSQSDMSLQCNAISHCLDASIELVWPSLPLELYDFWNLTGISRTVAEILAKFYSDMIVFWTYTFLPLEVLKMSW